MLFEYRLAEHLHCTVEELEQRVDMRELIRWREFDKREAIGGRRLDEGFALVAFAIARAHGRRARLSAFLPDYGRIWRKASGRAMPAREIEANLEAHFGKANQQSRRKAQR